MLLKSSQNLEVGKECLNKGQYDAAASRIYYAVFQAVLNWVRLKRGFVEQKDVHAAITRLMKVGTSSHLYHESFNNLRILRVKADYDPEPVEREELEDLLPMCERIIAFYKRQVE